MKCCVDEEYEDFAWQEGYGSFSCDYRNLDGLLEYVDKQKLHHYGDHYEDEVRMTFGDEFTKTLYRYGFDAEWVDDGAP